MNWLQLRINCSRDAVSEIEDGLLAAGAASVTLEDNADQPILEPALGEMPLWDDIQITGLFSGDTDTAKSSEVLLQHLGMAATAPHCPTLRWEILEDKDWERAWMEHYQPIRCGDNLWICPSWKQPPDPQAVNLMLDPGLAFGTGTHPTTFLCLQWLALNPPKGQRVLDFGCGSGILAIAAKLLGATSLCGVDIDPQALLATRENCLRNHLQKDAIELYFPDKAPVSDSDQRFDCIVANILAGPLVDLAKLLAGACAANGKICLSGILATQAESVIQAYKEWFDFDLPAEQEGWVRLTAICNRPIK